MIEEKEVKSININDISNKNSESNTKSTNNLSINENIDSLLSTKSSSSSENNNNNEGKVGLKSNQNNLNESLIDTNKYQDSPEALIMEEKYRWVIFSCFFFLKFSSAMHMFTISSIANNFKQAYNLSSFVVDSYALSYSVFIPMFFFASYIIDNKSMRLGVSSEKYKHNNFY